MYKFAAHCTIQLVIMTYGTAASRLLSVVSFVRPMNKNEKRITLVRRVNDMNAVTKSSG